MNIGIIAVKDYVVYKSLDGNLSLYKVLAIEQNFDKLDITINIIDYNGKLGRKKFTTTLKGKDGKQRIFRYWLQVKDRVIIKDTQELGEVTSLFVETTSDTLKGESYRNMVEILTNKQQQFTYSFDEVHKHIDLFTIQLGAKV